MGICDATNGDINNQFSCGRHFANLSKIRIESATKNGNYMLTFAEQKVYFLNITQYLYDESAEKEHKEETMLRKQSQTNL